LIVSNSSGSATGSGNVTLNGGILASAANGGSISGNVVAGTGSHTIAPGGIGTVGTLAIGGLTTSSLTTLNFDLGTGSGEITNGDLLTLGSGTVSIGASTPITFNGTPTLGNDYRLIGGTISGVNVNNFSLPAAPGGESYLLSDNGVDPGYIDLVVAAGAQSLTWTDASANNLWDNGISANWNNGTSTTTFAASDTVTFSDANGGNYAVTLNTTVLPAATFFTNTNNSNNYTISGTGTLGGTGALVKSGSGTVTLSTTSIYTGGTSVSAGKLIIDRVSSTISALPNGPLTISGTGDVQLAQNLTAGSNPGPTPTSNVNITSLSITGSGDLDITNNHIIIDYTPGHDPIASIAAMVASGYNSDHWNGPGIISSNAQTNFASYGIGYADSADTGNPAGLASNQIEIAYTLLGDANLDDKVNGADFTLMAANFNDSVTAGWDKGDFNYSGTVNGDDFVLLADNFNDFASQSAVAAADLAALDSFAASNGININLTSVPEPATAAVLLTGMGILGTRRRRKAR
jgi:autotransporter-associated beta strand protein